MLTEGSDLNERTSKLQERQLLSLYSYLNDTSSIGTDTAKDVVNLGEIAYWIEGKCIAIGYGQTPISRDTEIRLAAKTNIWGDANLSVEKLKNIKDGDEVIIS